MRLNAIPMMLFAACSADSAFDAFDAFDERAAELTAETPAEIAVPDGNHVVASYQATGFQIYECQPDAAGALAWKLRAPAAALFADDGALVAIHYGGIDAGLPAGPYWQSSLDGSRVHAGNAKSAPNAGSIPLLRLQALDHAGAGVLADVTFIQRLETTGGLAPTTRCKKNSSPEYVPYTAQYVFWAASLPRPVVPEGIVVPDGHDVAYIGHATGVQIYECALDASSNLTPGSCARRARCSPTATTRPSPIISAASTPACPPARTGARCATAAACTPAPRSRRPTPAPSRSSA
jgi:hypothetical protein